jgi:hypothetical protein
MSGIELLLTGIIGFVAGILAGLLGIGGGVVLVPVLVALGANPLQAVATSSLSIVVISISGTIQNWLMKQVDLMRVLALGLPAIATSQIGVAIGDALPNRLLLIAFGMLLLANLYLISLRKQVVRDAQDREVNESLEPSESVKQSTQSTLKAGLMIGGSAGLLSGMLGVGGGVIMVPLQILLLNETLKRSIQTSLAVIVITALASASGHAGIWPWLGNQLQLYRWLGNGSPWPVAGNVLWQTGLALGLSGFVGAQISARLLPKLPERVVSILFRSLLVCLTIYTFWEALNV